MKRIILSALAVLFSVSLFAQEAEIPSSSSSEITSTETQNIIETISEEENPSAENEQLTSSEKPAKKFSVDFFLTFEPTFIINTCSNTDSAVSPIVYPVSFGAVFFKDKLFSFHPRLSFFANYYLWVDDGAYPAEIENRTATVFSFMLDLPAVYSLHFKEKHNLEFGLGPSFDFRIAFLSHGVSGSDAGTTGTADGDVDEIRSYFWKNGNFFFMSTYISYLYSISKKLSIGPEFRFYLPVGQLASGNGMNDGMISLGVKARF